MAANWIKTRQTRYGAYVVVYVIVILAVIAAANWLANGYNKTIDVTANKRFTLSDQTKKVLANLTKDVNVYYFDKSTNYDQARDLLDRYSNLSSKFKITYVDPDKKPDLAQLEGATNYGDLVIDNGQKKEAAKALTEEEITGALIRASKTAQRTVCFVQGSGEHGLDDNTRAGYTDAKSALERGNIKTKAISLIEKPEVPQDCSVVMVGGPKNDYIAPVIDALKKFVAGGGSLFVNFDPVLTVGANDKRGATPALAAMVAEWGFTIKGDVVLDTSAASQLFGAESPIASHYGTHQIVKPMGNAFSVMRLSRSMEVKDPAEKLFSTGDESYALTDPKLPIREEDLAKGAKGPFVLGGAAVVKSGDKSGRVVVVGSSEWISNAIINARFGNRDLFLNAVNWLTSDAELISIRPVDPEDRRLNVTGTSIVIMRTVSIFLLPALVIFAGFSVWWKRR